MGNDDNLYKREEDRKWRESIDHQVVTLLTGHQVLDRRIEEMEDSIDEVDRTVRGDPGNMRSGMISRLERQEEMIAKLNAVIFMDAAGEKGLYEEFKRLRRGEARSEIHWKFLTAVVVASISTIGLLLTNWDRLKGLWPKDKPDKLEVMIENARHPKSRRRHYVIRENPDDGTAKENLPE